MKLEAIKYRGASEKCLVRFDVLSGGVYNECFFWDVMLCSLVGRCVISLFRAVFQPEMEVPSSSETLVSIYITTQHHTPKASYFQKYFTFGALYNHLLGYVLRASDQHPRAFPAQSLERTNTRK
jgi:hypothetical protein